MKAYVVDRSHPAGVSFVDLPDVRSRRGAAVVQVHATSLNRGEAMHVGKFRSLPEGAPIGWDLAGVVVEAATDGTGPSEGTKVFGWSAQRGTWAERVAVGVNEVAPLPDGLSMADGATLGVAALTAVAALDRGRKPLLGASVLVTGATGGVGGFALQLAGIGGARVIGVVRDDTSRAELRALLGPTVQLEVGLRPDGEPVDLIVESVGGPMLSAALRRVGVGGTVVTLGRTTDEPAQVPSGWFHKSAHLDGLSFSRDFTVPGRTEETLSNLARLVVDGRLNPNVTAVLPAEDLPDAIDGLLSRRLAGKVVVEFT